MENPKKSPLFRAEKTTKENDDRKVLLWGAIGTLILLLTYPLIDRIYDEYLAPRPFVSATVEMVRVIGKNEPTILYDADATQPVKGEWIASIFTVAPNGVETRIASRRGNGAYTDRIDETRIWTWEAFFDNELGVDVPPVPEVPFRVCVRYDVYSSDSEVHDETPNFCSEIYEP